MSSYHQPMVHMTVSRWQINLQFLSIYKIHMCYFNGPTPAGQVYLSTVAGDRNVSIENANEEAVNTAKSLFTERLQTRKSLQMLNTYHFTRSRIRLK
jgi:threonine synthase